MPGLLSSRSLILPPGLLLLTALWLGLSALAVADSGNAEGFAYSEDGKKLLYTEVHHWQGVLHTVEYFRPDGKLVSVNELDSSSSFISPVYKQYYPQARFADGKFAEGAQWRDEKLVLFSGDKEKVVEFQPPLVLSSGFYHFILDHWRELQAGQSLSFDFAVPSRFSTVRLRMHALADGGSAVVDGDPNWFYVRVEVANSLLRWLVKPLTVALDDKQRLMFYHGISNVRDDRGDTPQVLIRYRYPAALSSNGPVPRVDK